MSLKWRIWYADGTHFDSSMGEPEDAPFDNVVCITTDDPEHYGPGRYIHKGMDYYVWDEDYNRWVGVDEIGLIMWLIRTGKVKFGRMIPGGKYRDIIYRACHDKDFEGKPPVDKEHVGNAVNGWLNG